MVWSIFGPMEAERIPSYKIEGYLTLVYAGYSFFMSAILFFGAILPWRILGIAETVTAPLYFFLFIRLAGIFRSFLDKKWIAACMYASIAISLVSYVLFTVPLAYLDSEQLLKVRSDWAEIFPLVASTLKYMHIVVTIAM